MIHKNNNSLKIVAGQARKHSGILQGKNMVKQSEADFASDKVPISCVDSSSRLEKSNQSAKNVKLSHQR